MAVALDRKTFVAALIKMSDAGGAVGGVVTLSVSECYPSHIVGQIAICSRPKQQMPMVTHNAITANPHIDPLKTFSQNRFKSLEIGILTKNTQSAISTIGNVINVAA